MGFGKTIMLPYYSVCIDDERRTVDAIDENGAVIVSLIFQDHAELCSDEFQRSIRDAVALASLDYTEESLRHGEGDDLVDVMWEEQLKQARHVDELEQMKHVLEMIEKEELQKRKEDEERDRRIAMEMQIEEEEAAIAKVEKCDQKSRPWNTPNPWKTLCHSDDGLQEETEVPGFPSLPATTSPQKIYDFKPKGNILDKMTDKRDASNLYMDDADDQVTLVMNDWKPISHMSGQSIDSQLNTVDKSDKDFILSAASSAMEKETKKRGGVSAESLKKMMSTTDSFQGQHGADETYAGVDREKYSRKSIRKLVLDMITAGWLPLRRGGGHYIYERTVAIPNMDPFKQVLVLPSTPSTQKNIDLVYAKLIKYDREVAERMTES